MWTVFDLVTLSWEACLFCWCWKWVSGKVKQPQRSQPRHSKASVTRNPFLAWLPQSLALILSYAVCFLVAAPPVIVKWLPAFCPHQLRLLSATAALWLLAYVYLAVSHPYLPWLPLMSRCVNDGPTFKFNRWDALFRWCFSNCCQLNMQVSWGSRWKHRFWVDGIGQGLEFCAWMNSQAGWCRRSRDHTLSKKDFYRYHCTLK